MSRTNPPLRISPTTPATMAAIVTAVRPAWRNTLRSASLSTDASVIAPQRVDDRQVRRPPGRINTCRSRSNGCQRQRAGGQSGREHDLANVAVRHAGRWRHRDADHRDKERKDEAENNPRHAAQYAERGS